MKIVEIHQFQWKWVHRIKHVKRYRMKSMSLYQKRILSELYNLNPEIYENSGNISISMQADLSDEAR